jgi:hypothetical protein
MTVKILGDGDMGPIFQLGQIVRETGKVGIYEVFDVGVTISRRNSLEHIGGHHFAVMLHPPMPWEEARNRKIFGESLALLFRELATRELLGALLPTKSIAELSRLEWRGLSNSAGTARRGDVHAHIPILDRDSWQNVHQLVDDARPPRHIADEALALAGVSRERVRGVIDRMFQEPKKK